MNIKVVNLCKCIRHAFIAAVVPRLLFINGYVQTPTGNPPSMVHDKPKHMQSASIISYTTSTML